MATQIVFNYQQMSAAAQTITTTCKAEYEQAASQLMSSLANATANWTGASKEKFMAFLTGAVNTYIGTTIPELVQATGELLASNAQQMAETDQAIAQNIPEALS